jgi:cytochrome b6-f complex iron-sulfur subunit
MTMDKGMDRRTFLKLLGWTGLGTLTAGELTYAGFRFIAPRAAAGEFGGIFTVGAVDDFPPGSVTPFNEGRFFLVRLADGGFLALYRSCTHLGCAVPWDAEKGRFVCPCHGSEFEADGAVINPPAPRPLDLFRVTIEGGQVMVNTGDKVRRDHPGDSQAVYA